METDSFTRVVEMFERECQVLTDFFDRDFSSIFIREDLLIPGLPDDIVLNHIWPRIRKDLEEEGRTSQVPPLRNFICGVCHLSVTSKSWRCLLTNSAIWAPIRILGRHGNMFGHFNMKARYFRHHIRNLPPIDSFSKMDFRRLSDHLRKWEEYNISERDSLLQVRPKDKHDPQDVLGRFESWKLARCEISPGLNWIVDD